jgi:hypothetical protein
VREHVWFDPAQIPGGDGEPLPAVPDDSRGADEVAEHGERNAEEVVP